MIVDIHKQALYASLVEIIQMKVVSSHIWRAWQYYLPIIVQEHTGLTAIYACVLIVLIRMTI